MDNYSEFFYNQQVRTAQFNFIERITSSSYVHQMRKFNIEPYEIRPLFVDEVGRNKVFNINEVPRSERVSFNFDNNIIGLQCYRANRQFIKYCKILFTENYEDPNSPLYANGYVIVPLNYVFNEEGLDTLYELSEHTFDFGLLAKDAASLIAEKFMINVYAMPLEDNFTCNNEFDIIFSARDNILVQKNYLTA